MFAAFALLLIGGRTYEFHSLGRTFFRNTLLGRPC